MATKVGGNQEVWSHNASEGSVLEDSEHLSNAARASEMFPENWW